MLLLANVLVRVAYSQVFKELGLVATSKDELATCNIANQGSLSYVESERTFKVCNSGDWISISIDLPRGASGNAGPPGASGRIGTQGIQGPRGPVGEAGNAGAQGALGPVGLAGPAGTTGLDGANAVNPSVILLDGTAIGKLIYQYSNLYWQILMDDGARIEVSQSSGHLRSNNYFLWSGINCTGIRRVTLANGYFGNVIEDPLNTGEFYRATGGNLGVFSYQSRIVSGACSNQTGTANASWATESYEFGVAYPLGMLVLVN